MSSDFQSNCNRQYEYWMQYALQLAQFSWNKGEVPVGAVLIYDNEIIGEGWNQSISCHDPTAHAEIVALRQGGLTLKNYRLLRCTLYVTLEPCLMCLGAIIHGRIGTLVYGAHSRKEKYIKAYTHEINSITFFHCTRIIGGVLAPLCSEILKKFFRVRRLQKSSK